MSASEAPNKIDTSLLESKSANSVFPTYFHRGINPWQLSFIKQNELKAFTCNFTKRDTPPCVISTLFELYKLYLIVKKRAFMILL